MGWGRVGDSSEGEIQAAPSLLQSLQTPIYDRTICFSSLLQADHCHYYLAEKGLNSPAFLS